MSDNQNKFLALLKQKNIVFSAKRYGIDALSAMAQGLFASLLIGTIMSTLGDNLGISILSQAGTFAKGVSGPAMAASIGYALQSPPLVLFSLIAVGGAANELGGAGGPLAVLIVTIFAAEFGKAVSKETKVDILVTPFVTIFIGTVLSLLWAPAIGAAASKVGSIIMWATELQPFFMGILVSVIVESACCVLQILSGSLSHWKRHAGHHPQFGAHNYHKQNPYSNHRVLRQAHLLKASQYDNMYQL